MLERKQGKAGGAEAPQRRSEYAQGRGRSGAAAMSEKSGGPVKRSRRKEKQRKQNRLLSICHKGPMGSSMVVGSQKTVLS